ncbi:MAG: TonB-dependent receptor plug domain-containing protein [Flavobacteriaceae bacterium]|nr:MAG: TonB-dependent receptor plug domain-containing protein [Flavobacteriaceae bacterium]
MHAQTFKLSGKVVDQNQEPLADAAIFIKEINKGTSTNLQGAFTFNLEQGNYLISISFVGFITKEQKITLAKDQTIVIELSPNSITLDEVLVSAIRANSEIPVTYSNLSKKEIAKRNLGQDIPVLLNYLPSVVSSSDAGAGIGYTYLNVRGSNGERINVTINGIPYNDAESHGTFWVNLGDFASSTENLQLQRGVGTSTNGSGAFGASLNILTDAVSEKSYGEISNSFGSFGTGKHTAKWSTGKLNEHFEISGRLSNIYSDGYVDRAFADLKSYFLQGAYSDDNTLVKTIVFGGKERTYQAWFGLTAQQLEDNRRQNPYTYENEVDDYKQDHYQLHWNEKWNDRWSTNLGLNYTQGAGFFEQFKDEESIAGYNGIVVATNGNGGTDLIVRRWLDNTFYVANFNTDYKNEHLNVITGISYIKYTGDHFGEVIWAQQFAPNANIRDRYYFSDSKKTDFNVFTKATYKFNENFSGYIDLQGRFINYKTQGITSDIDAINVDATFDFFNPKMGFIYQLKENSSLYLSFARANREPNRNDFEGGVTTHETLDDIEFGWRLKKKYVKLHTNLYFMNYTNQLVLTGALDDVGAPVRATSGKSYRLGLEVDAEISLSDQFSIRPNLALSQNRNRNFKAPINGIVENLGNTPLSFSPNIILGNIITYQPKESFQISLLSKYVGKQFMSNLNSRISENDVLKSFFTSDLNFVYQIETKTIFDSITISGLINNIFNAKYVDRGYYFTFDFTGANGSTITGDGAGYYPQATINFLLGLTLKF